MAVHSGAHGAIRAPPQSTCHSPFPSPLLSPSPYPMPRLALPSAYTCTQSHTHTGADTHTHTYITPLWLLPAAFNLLPHRAVREHTNKSPYPPPPPPLSISLSRALAFSLSLSPTCPHRATLAPSLSSISSFWCC